MNKIDWKRKLTSRKFWAMIAGFITGILIYINSPEKSPEAIGGIIMSLGSIVAYIFGEGIADYTSDTFTTNYNSPNVFGDIESKMDESEEQNNG